MQPPPIYFDSRWNGNHGIGRFSSELQRRLPGLVPLPIIGPKLSPIDSVALTWALVGKRNGCFLSPGFNAPLASPVPFVFTIHDLVHLRVPQESTALRRLYYTGIVRPGAARARAILTVSEYSKKEIVSWANLDPRKVHVVGNGVSPIFTPGPEFGRASRRPFLLHVGRRAGHKNIETLLRAFAASGVQRELHLMFTGAPDGPTQEAAARWGVTDRIRFSGPLDDQALLSLYREAIALVFPSLHEGFGLPIVEAMAAGTPVITSNVTSMPEVAGAGNALFVDPLSVEELACALEAIVIDTEKWQTLSLRGIDRAKQFSWERVSAQVYRAIQASSQAD